ncbi:hypothetical protein ACEQ8H_001603 [Pleosporales sp. CAS-2024a]
MGYSMVHWGAGVHQWQVTLNQLFNQLYWANTAQVIYCPLSFLVKMAILLQYLNLFAPSRQANRAMFYGSWCTIFANLVSYTVFMFWTLFYCAPRRMIWFKLTPGGKCHNVDDMILSQGAFNMASDVVILLLPTIPLWQLNVPLSKKLYITAIFATGLLYVYIFTLKIKAVISVADVSRNGLFIGLWTEAEVALGFIVACSLCLPKFVKVKGKKVRDALSHVSSPWSSLGSKSRKSGTWSSSRKSTQVGSRALKQVDMGRSMFYEEREELHKQEQARRKPEKAQHDIYVIPSTAGNSEHTPSTYTASQYSQSAKSRTFTCDQVGVNLAAAVARPAFPTTVSARTLDVPVRLDPTDITTEQLEDERMVQENFEFK